MLYMVSSWGQNLVVRANIISWEGNKVVWINIVHFFFVVVLGHGQVITNELVYMNKNQKEIKYFVVIYILTI